MVELLPFSELHPNYRFFALAKLTATGLKLQFELQANAASAFEKIIFPQQINQPARKDLLWQQTCFECFIACDSKLPYLELNASPSGDWNLYVFSDYRKRVSEVLVLAPSEVPKQIKWVQEKNEVKSEWSIPLEALKKGFASVGIQFALDKIQLGLTAVLKTKKDTEYWAIQHQGDKPDFHLRSSFIYSLAKGEQA